jgi:hypothetical protein
MKSMVGGFEPDLEATKGSWTPEVRLQQLQAAQSHGH